MGSQKKYDLKSFEKKLIKNTKHAKKIAENMTPEMAEKIVGPLERWGSGPDTAYDHVAYELFYPDRIVATWKNIGSLAQRFCDTPQDVLDLLVKYGAKDFKVSDQKRFYLVSFINNEMNKKINKGIGLRTIIGENLEACNRRRPDRHRQNRGRRSFRVHGKTQRSSRESFCQPRPLSDYEDRK